MLSGKEDSLKEVKQMELFPMVKKELPKHPKHWDEEEVGSIPAWGTFNVGSFLELNSYRELGCLSA